MIQNIVLLATFLQLTKVTLVHTAKQHVQLSDSYLPVAMQVIAHLTDQMAYEVKDEPQPTTKPPKATTKAPKPTIKPTKAPWKPTSKPQLDITTPHHNPGLYAPFAPPKQNERQIAKTQFVLLPLESNSEYTVIQPPERKTEEPLLSIHNEEVKPLMEPSPEEMPLLPPHFDADKISRSDILNIDEDLNDDGLQYLSHTVREMIRMANDDNDERVVDVWEGLRSGPEPTQKVKLSGSNLRLLLLYDLLSREAKRQRLSDYGGFSPDVMKNLVDSSSGSARDQLKMALSKMVDRRDCEHQYANNRAREMVSELERDESALSSELRYLQPLNYVN
ncbi:unnamed protein product [Diatraea saccharalis]|uniref:Uncharacterized protein n=1 Tax=Diatraea saccharalis TaxID=40085 RepID=A0A9N9WFU5_9NEOP|nr:unnamed protein product [Diatraea saccharalis]